MMRSPGIEAGIHAVVEGREVYVVADDVALADLGQPGRLLAYLPGRQQLLHRHFGHIALRQGIACSAGNAAFKIKGIGCPITLTPPGGAARKPSISSRVRFSVTATSRQSSIPG